MGVSVEEIVRCIDLKKLQAGKFGTYEKVEDKTDEKVKKKGPVSLDAYEVPPFNIVESTADGAEGKRRNVLSKILAFVSIAQKRRHRETCTIMPIATTSNSNLAIWGSPMNVSRAIDKMIEIGLLAEHDEVYRFNAPYPYDDENRCKSYKYFYENEQKFIEYCKAHGIEKFNPKNLRQFTEKEKVAIKKVNGNYKEFKVEDVVFSSNLNLIKPIDVSVAEFEDYIKWCLYNNYPALGFMQGKVDEINERFYKDYPEFAIRFVPTIRWNSKRTKIEKIGIRATNPYCNKSKEEREKILDERGLVLRRDIKSSVPRLTLSLNTGSWVGETADIYELINAEFEPEVPFTEERREAIKSLHMAAYFETHSDIFMGKNVWNRMVKSGLRKEDVYETMQRLKAAITKVEGGKLYGSEIFFVESCVYLMTVYDLLCSGHMVWLVYDAFYSKGGTYAEDYETMIAEGVKMNFQDFIEKIGFKK